MRFGFFDQLPRADWQSESQRYQDILAQIELGDALGFIPRGSASCTSFLVSPVCPRR